MRNEIGAEVGDTQGPIPGAGPFRIFDRERTGHLWEGVFKELERPAPDMRWAVAANWRMDHRVSEERETGDLEASGHFNGVVNADGWWRARDRYFKRELCRAGLASADGPASAYCRPMNKANLVPAGVAGFDELVHVGSMNAMLRRISQDVDWSGKVEERLKELTGQSFSLNPPGSGDLDWLEKRIAEIAQSMLAQGADTIRQVAGLLADAMGEAEPPWWAAFVEEIRETVVSGSAADFCTALGLGHRVAGEWLLIWRYPVQEVSPVYRPTAVEANDSPYHFPSPPEHDWGIAMPLDPSVAACREVIHRPLRGPAAAERCTGRLLLLERTPVIGDNGGLAALRASHRERLKREFGFIENRTWLDRHSDSLL